MTVQIPPYLKRSFKLFAEHKLPPTFQGLSSSIKVTYAVTMKMKNCVRLALFVALFAPLTSMGKTVVLSADQMDFDFISSEGSFWFDCIHKKLSEPHQWQVNCPNDQRTFRLHLMLNEYLSQDEVTYELHFWADRDEPLQKRQTRTQSTWITLDRAAKAKKIVSFLGFDEDATQFRLELRLKSNP
jgi:hypothetical protein